MKILLALAALGPPLFMLMTSWILDRWPVLIFDTVAMGAAGLLLLAYVIRPFPLRVHWSIGAPLLAAAIGVAQLQTGATVNPNATLLRTYDWLGLAAEFFLLLQFFALDRRLTRYFPGVALAFSLMYGVYAVVQWFTSQGRIFWYFSSPAQVDRVLGTILNRNHYAAFIELFLPAVFWHLLESPRRNPHAAIAAGVLFASIVASASRGGFAVAIIELIVVYLLQQYWNSRMYSEHSHESSNWYIGGAVATVLVFTAAIGIGPLQERLLGPRASELIADYGQSRWEYAEASGKMIRARPVLGFGFGTWPEVYPSFGSFDSPDIHVNHAHNDPMEWLSEGGLVFLLPLAILIFVCVQIAYRQPWALGPAGVLIHSLVDFPLQKPAIFAALWIFVAAGIERSRTD